MTWHGKDRDLGWGIGSVPRPWANRGGSLQRGSLLGGGAKGHIKKQMLSVSEGKLL